MTRHRIFSNNTDTDTSSYIKNKSNIVNFKNFMLKENNNNNKVNSLFKMKADCNGKSIYNYNNYNTLVQFSKIQSKLNPNCSTCDDIPFNLIDGNSSEICYEELFIEKDCTIIPNINKCKIKSDKLYPYGHFNNYNKNSNISIHSVKDFKYCMNKLECDTYKYCKCPYWIQNCCPYTITFPLNTQNITYYDNDTSLNNLAFCNCNNISIESRYNTPFNKLQQEELNKLRLKKYNETMYFFNRSSEILNNSNNNDNYV